MEPGVHEQPSLVCPSQLSSTGVVQSSAVGVTSPIFAGGTATLTGSVFDPDLGDSASLLIDWGDGGSDIVNFATPGLNNFSLNHSYAEHGPTGTLAINVTATDAFGASSAANVSILVKPAPQAARFLGLVPLGTGHMLLQLQGSPTITYRIEYSDNLVSWSELGSAMADGSGALSFEDVAPAPTSRFYRAVAVP